MRRLCPLLVVVLVACSSQKEAPPAAAPAASQPGTMITATSTSPQAIEHFNKGYQLLDNTRTAEAVAEFDLALRADPQFVLARAMRGFAVPSVEGMKELDEAAKGTAKLPEAERAFVEALATTQRGDLHAAEVAFTRVTTLAPDDWRAHNWLGTVYSIEQKYGDAVSAYTKATTLNPDAGVAQNGLGYAALQQGDAAGAVTAFQAYARILPQEPNPQDSLGEALLASGRFPEAEAAFQKALALSPQFWNAYQGLAYAKLYAGDWAGGRAALEKAKQTATRPGEKIGLDQQLAAVALAQRDAKTAVAITEGMARTADADPGDLAFVPVLRAQMLNAAGRYRDALAPIAAALAEADSAKLPQGQTRTLRGLSLVERVLAEAGLRDAAAATRTSAALDAGAAEDIANPLAQSAMHFGRGMLAVAKGESAEARQHLDQCSSQDIICKWQGLIAAEKAGDATGAATARAALLKNYLRDPRHLLMRSQIAPQAAAATPTKR